MNHARAATTMTPPDGATPAARRWHEFDPWRTLELIGVLSVVVALMFTLSYRRQVAAIPAPGHANLDAYVDEPKPQPQEMEDPPCTLLVEDEDE